MTDENGGTIKFWKNIPDGDIVEIRASELLDSISHLCDLEDIKLTLRMDSKRGHVSLQRIGKAGEPRHSIIHYADKPPSKGKAQDYKHRTKKHDE